MLKTILEIATKNIPLTAVVVWGVSFPCVILYKVKMSKIERFPTTVKYERTFMRFKDSIKVNTRKG